MHIVMALYKMPGKYVSRIVNAIKMQFGKLFLLVEAEETWKLNEAHSPWLERNMTRTMAYCTNPKGS